MSSWGERIAAPALAAAAAAWWGIGLTVLQPLTEPEKPWTALSVGNNAYWARDVRWTMIMLALAAFVWSCRGDKRRSRFGVIAALGWVGLDLWLDRIDLSGATAAWWTAGAAGAVAAGACLAARAGRPRHGRAALVAAASIAAVCAGVMGAVQSPSDTESGLAWSGYVIAGFSAVLALGCAASASPMRRRSVAVTLALIGVCVALIVLMWQPFPGEPARWWSALGLSTVLLSAVLTRLWTPPGGLVGYALTPMAVGVGLTVLAFGSLPLVMLGLGAPFTLLAGNPPVNGADTDSVDTVLTLVVGLAIGAAVHGSAFRGGRRAAVGTE